LKVKVNNKATIHNPINSHYGNDSGFYSPAKGTYKVLNLPINEQMLVERAIK